MSLIFNNYDYHFWAAIKRVFVTADPTLQTHFTLENPVIETGDFEISLDMYTASSSSLQTLIGTPTGSDSFFRLDNISISAVIKVKLGGVELPIPAATLTLNKLHNLRISRVGTTFTVHVDGTESGSETNAAWGADFEIGKIGTLGSNLQFFDGIIANVDLGNGNAWKINKPTGNIEPSAGGGNDLTYVNAPDSIRELFTFNQSVTPNRWVSGGLWTLPTYSFTGAELSGDIPQSQNILVEGLNYSVVFSGSGSNLGIATGSGGSTRALIGNVSLFADNTNTFSIAQDVTAGTVTARWQVFGTPPFSGDIKLSVNRFFEVA